VINTVRASRANGSDSDADSIEDRELIAGHVESITVKSGALEIRLVKKGPLPDVRSFFVCGDQSGRTSAPINPHAMQTMRFFCRSPKMM
jgi:hypothetical protein